MHFEHLLNIMYELITSGLRLLTDTINDRFDEHL